MKKFTAIALATAALIALLAANYLGLFKPPAATLIGKPLESINLVDLAGSKHDISELTGQPTTVYFWASWCKPCLETLRDLAQGRKAPPKGTFVAIAIDDDQALVKDMIQRTGFKGQVLIATDGMKLIQQRYAGNDKRAVPYVVSLNASGEMVARRYGL